MEAVPDNDMDDELNDSALLEISSTPPEYLGMNRCWKNLDFSSFST